MTEEYSSKDLDHLGIVSAMCDEINLVGVIDQLIPPASRATMRLCSPTQGKFSVTRFFEAEHENLFDSLLANMRIPGRPQQQYHDMQKRLLGRKKRRVA